MAEKKFIPKPGQVDYTNIRYAPVINTIVTDDKEILLVQRSADMRLYPSFWNGISGFLDDDQSIEQKAQEELREEVGFSDDQIKDIRRGNPFLQEAPEYNKTWLVVPVLATVDRIIVKTNWESQQAKWFLPKELKALQLMPGFDDVIRTFYPEVI